MWRAVDGVGGVRGLIVTRCSYHAYLQKSKDDVDEASKPNMLRDADAGQPAAALLASGSKEHSTNAIK